MRYAQGILRALLLAVIVTFGSTTPAAADPEGSCPGDYDVGERACDCDPMSGGGATGRVYECESGGWEHTGQTNIYADVEECEQECEAV
jgi:hypothetical protein